MPEGKVVLGIVAAVHLGFFYECSNIRLARLIRRKLSVWRNQLIGIILDRCQEGVDVIIISYGTFGVQLSRGASHSVRKWILLKIIK